MNAETDAVLQICVTLPKLKLASVTLEEDNCHLNFLTYNAFKILNRLLMNNTQNGFRLAHLPYEVSLSVSIPLKIYEKVDWNVILEHMGMEKCPHLAKSSVWLDYLHSDCDDGENQTWRDRPPLL